MRRLVGLERRNFRRRSTGKLGQQHAGRQVHGEILDLSVGQRARVNTQVIELALEQAPGILIPNFQRRGSPEGAAERILGYLGFPNPAIHTDLQARSLARTIIVNQYVVCAIHRHTILGAHFDSGIRPALREPCNDAKIPLMPACVRDVVKTKLIASPVLGGIFFLKNFAALQPVEIYPHAERKRLARVEISSLLQADFRFATEFSGLAGWPVFIDNFASHEFSIVFQQGV